MSLLCRSAFRLSGAVSQELVSCVTAANAYYFRRRWGEPVLPRGTGLWLGAAACEVLGIALLLASQASHALSARAPALEGAPESSFRLLRFEIDAMAAYDGRDK